MDDLDENNRKILEVLLTQQCAKPDFTEISRLTGINISTVSYRIKKLQEQCYFKGFVPVIGEKIGYWVFDTKTPLYGRFPDEVLTNPQVRQIYIGTDRSYVFYSGSTEQMFNLQSKLNGKYALESMPKNILNSLVRSVPFIQKK